MPPHTPYDGSSTPFSIGLKPLAAADWIEVDEHYDVYLREKRRLYAEHLSDVFAAEEGTTEAQGEVQELLARHMEEQFPHLQSAPTDPAAPPLKTASLLVQEDLVLMRKGEDGWRLAAASLCFPSSWSLAEKFRQPLADIHKPVPQFGRDTRNAQLIERMFDSLQGQMVVRWNWSLQADAELYHPLSHSQRDVRAVEPAPRFADGNPFIRVERQTLRKMPRSGDILFTIRIHLDPLRVLASHPDRATVAQSFAAQLAALDTGQLAYKGLAADRDSLVSALEAIATRD